MNRHKLIETEDITWAVVLLFVNDFAHVTGPRAFNLNKPVFKIQDGRFDFTTVYPPKRNTSCRHPNQPCGFKETEETSVFWNGQFHIDLWAAWNPGIIVYRVYGMGLARSGKYDGDSGFKTKNWYFG